MLSSHSNYLPHNGVATIQQFVDATVSVFDMGPVSFSTLALNRYFLTIARQDLATFLSTYGAIVDGTLTSWSIAGGPHVGIGGSHNNYESDSSPLKADLHQYGSNTKLILEQFNNVRPFLHSRSTRWSLIPVTAVQFTTRCFNRQLQP